MEHKTNMIPEEKLESVSGGKKNNDPPASRYNVGETVTFNRQGDILTGTIRAVDLITTGPNLSYYYYHYKIYVPSAPGFFQGRPVVMTNIPEKDIIGS